MVVPHCRSVGSTRSRDRHVINPKGGYSALFFSCTSCMGTSTSKVGETETGRGGHGKGATRTRSWSEGTRRGAEAMGTTTTTGTRRQLRQGQLRQGDGDRDNYEDNGEGTRCEDVNGAKIRRSRPEWRRISLGHVKFLDCSSVVESLRFLFP